MVRRYWPENGYDSVMRACASMKEAPDGAYVDYADYRDLAKRCERLEAVLRKALEWVPETASKSARKLLMESIKVTP